MKTPYIASEWKMLFEPKEHGDYINDHSVVFGPDGKWHLFGITSFASFAANERYFAHGVGESLESQFTEVGRSIDRGTLAWAPGVIEKDTYYYMFYGPSPTSLAVSFDMYEWTGQKINLNNEPLLGAIRDHFVLKISDSEYLMYITGMLDKKGAISCFRSTGDLRNWDFVGYALTSGDDAPLIPPWGAFESPYVVKKDGLYYLFTTYTDCALENYNDTLVFVSSDPTSFGQYNGGNGGAIPVTKLHAHAPEILVENGNYYITSCGWRNFGAVCEGGVGVARLEWKEND